jgi:hypothetical protein
VGWLIAIIVLIALIWFMIVSPGFRVFIIGIVVLGVIAIFGWIEHEKKESERRQQTHAAQERAALSSIAPSDIALDKVQLKKGASSWTLTGNVTNNSKYPLGSLVFMVLIEDCPEWAVVDAKKKNASPSAKRPRGYTFPSRRGKCERFHYQQSISRGCQQRIIHAGATRLLKFERTECGPAHAETRVPRTGASCVPTTGPVQGALLEGGRRFLLRREAAVRCVVLADRLVAARPAVQDGADIAAAGEDGSKGCVYSHNAALNFLEG